MLSFYGAETRLTVEVITEELGVAPWWRNDQVMYFVQDSAGNKCEVLLG